MNRSLGTVVVGVGQLEKPDPLLQAAVRLVGDRAATIIAVHTYRLPDPFIASYPDIVTMDPELATAAEQALLRQLEEQINSLGASTVQARVLPGPPDLAILNVAEETGADLIMVGVTERGAISRAVLGTTAGRIVRTSAVPVMIQRSLAPSRPRKILLTTDLSELSGSLYRNGLEIARRLADPQADFRALFVVGQSLPVVPDVQPSFLQSVRERDLDPFLERWTPEGVSCEGRVRLGDPSAEIRAEAEEWGADLLVVGTHGRSGFSRLLIGSVAESISRRAACDVLVVPARGIGEETTEDDQPNS
ncbi:MAG TPA: universal stress protein [Longimicrobiaceae bacterium]